MAYLLPAATVDNAADLILPNAKLLTYLSLAYTRLRKLPYLVHLCIRQFRQFAAVHIYSLGHGLEMGRVNATRLLTHMVQYESVWDGTVGSFPIQTMGHNVPSLVACRYAISASPGSKLPYPAGASVAPVFFSVLFRLSKVVAFPIPDVLAPDSVFIADGSPRPTRRHTTAAHAKAGWIRRRQSRCCSVVPANVPERLTLYPTARPVGVSGYPGLLPATALTEARWNGRLGTSHRGQLLMAHSRAVSAAPGFFMPPFYSESSVDTRSFN